MFIYPEINPVLLTIGPLQLHWYGLMYLIGFAGAWLFARWRIKKYQLNWSNEELSDLIFYSAIGVVCGGRLGYMVFYNLSSLIHEPLSLFKVWQGGMSFHGGLLGAILAFFIFASRKGKRFFEVTDFAVPLVPIGLFAGRIGNFINGELWGRVTDVPWAVVFRHVDNLPRHPSQLYEMVLEGIVLFFILAVYSSRARPVKAVSGMFLICYGLFRFFAEFFREPDVGLGFIAFDWLTMGQLLSIPMIMGGMFMLYLSKMSVKSEAY